MAQEVDAGTQAAKFREYDKKDMPNMALELTA
jgi:hypothetical protein